MIEENQLEVIVLGEEICKDFEMKKHNVNG